MYRIDIMTLFPSALTANCVFDNSHTAFTAPPLNPSTA